MIKMGVELVQEVKANIHEASVEQLNDNIDKDIVLIDVREPEEFLAGHIEQAWHFPRGVLEMKLHTHPDFAQFDQPLEQMARLPIYLICRSGARSAFAAESLHRMGFKAVYSVAGGMLAWQEKGLPVQKG